MKCDNPGCDQDVNECDFFCSTECENAAQLLWDEQEAARESAIRWRPGEPTFCYPSTYLAGAL